MMRYVKAYAIATGIALGAAGVGVGFVRVMAYLDPDPLLVLVGFLGLGLVYIIHAVAQNWLRGDE